MELSLPRRRLPVEAIGLPAVRLCDGVLLLCDHLIGAQHNRWGYGKTECRGGLEVHHHLEFCRQLHREIARLLAA